MVRKITVRTNLSNEQMHEVNFERYGQKETHSLQVDKLSALKVISFGHVDLTGDNIHWDIAKMI